MKIYFRRHAAIDHTLSHPMVKDFLVPIALGAQTYNSLKEDVVQSMLKTVPQYAGHFNRYADRVFDLEDKLGARLAALPPKEFEQMLHPVFQEDEWMILLLGGVLGVLVGFLQGLALGA